jgi:hypothetical protein
LDVDSVDDHSGSGSSNIRTNRTDAEGDVSDADSVDDLSRTTTQSNTSRTRASGSRSLNTRTNRTDAASTSQPLPHGPGTETNQSSPSPSGSSRTHRTAPVSVSSTMPSGSASSNPSGLLQSAPNPIIPTVPPPSHLTARRSPELPPELATVPTCPPDAFGDPSQWEKGWEGLDEFLAAQAPYDPTLESYVPSSPVNRSYRSNRDVSPPRSNRSNRDQSLPDARRESFAPPSPVNRFNRDLSLPDAADTRREPSGPSSPVNSINCEPNAPPSNLDISKTFPGPSTLLNVQPDNGGTPPPDDVSNVFTEGGLSSTPRNISLPVGGPSTPRNTRPNDDATLGDLSNIPSPLNTTRSLPPASPSVPESGTGGKEIVRVPKRKRRPSISDENLAPLGRRVIALPSRLKDNGFLPAPKKGARRAPKPASNTGPNQKVRAKGK